MSDLKFKMLNGSDPQGRQKIYFCCHPDDFDACFPLVCGDIFSKDENCAVFYEADPRGGYDRKDLLFQLGAMQLFVVAVTRKLLTEPNRAMELELPFALGRLPKEDGPQRHIAVLPILFGSGLMDLYNEAAPFKGVQYLNRLADDKTALSYGEKLQRCLQSVLVSGEDDARIRKEFRAGIFLSYRKIDRALARKLMERIHRHALCRDVSIWYDEYLVPGESWRAAIDNALQKSDLFVLNVTPQLLEKGNFVWKEEYPNAIRAGKPILPVVSEKTALDELADMYQDVKEHLVGELDEDALEDGLVWGLVDKAGRKGLLTPDDGAEHLYYIGLGYKNSVGVETDAERAVRLLEDAGEGGCRRAWLTLGGMYANGDGVERDEDRAIGYYDRFIRLQTPDFGTSKTGDLDLLLAYDAKGMILLNHSRLTEALANYEELNRLLEAMTSCFGSFKQINLPASYERLGMIKKAMGDPAAAQEYYAKALDCRLHPPVTRNIATAADREEEQDAQAYNEFHMKEGLAVNLYSMGELCLANRDIAGAKHNLGRANKLFIELAKEHEDRDMLLNLGKSYLSLGRLSEAQGDPGGALKQYELADQTLESVAANPQDFEAQGVAIVVMLCIALVYRDTGRLQRSHMLLSDALGAAQKLCEADDSEKNRGLLATVYERAGTVEDMMGRTSAARGLFEQSIEISEKLAEGSETAEYKRDLAIAYEKYAQMLMRDREDERPGDKALARQYLEKDLALTRELAGSEADLQSQRDLSVCFDALFNAWLYEDAEKALEYGVRGLEIAYKLAQEIRQPKELYELGISYYGIGRICADVNPLCFDYAERLWSAAYRATGAQEIGNMLKQLQSLRQIKNPRFPLGPGYCRDLNELAARWPEGSARDYTDLDPVLSKKRPGASTPIDRQTPGPGGSGGGGDAPETPKRGCLQGIVALLIGLCGLLQWTGLVDIKGFWERLLGPKGPTIFAFILAAVFVLSGFISKKPKK